MIVVFGGDEVGLDLHGLDSGLDGIALVFIQVECKAADSGNSSQSDPEALVGLGSGGWCRGIRAEGCPKLCLGKRTSTSEGRLA